MILHPTVIANLLASLIVSGMILYSAYYGLQIVRYWDLSSGSELQLAMERRTYLISTILSYVFALELLSLFLYVFTADSLCPLFVGAMCAAGTLNVNAFGYPALLLKMFNFFLAGLWLILNYADNQAYDYPLIRKKYLLLVVIAPLILAELVLQSAYFLNMKADVITSCCGSLFSSERVEGLGSEIAALSPKTMLWVFYGSVAMTIITGIHFYLRQRGGYLFSALAIITFPISIISVISLYIYELPTHHCPFCILQKEYHYVGYLLYLALFGALVSGGGVAALISFRTIESLRAVIPALVRKLAVASIVLYSVFTATVTYRIAVSHLIM